MRQGHPPGELRCRRWAVNRRRVQALSDVALPTTKTQVLVHRPPGIWLGLVPLALGVGELDEVVIEGVTLELIGHVVGLAAHRSGPSIGAVEIVIGPRLADVVIRPRLAVAVLLVPLVGGTGAFGSTRSARGPLRSSLPRRRVSALDEIEDHGTP